MASGDLGERAQQSGAGHRTLGQEGCARSARKILDVTLSAQHSYDEVVERGAGVLASLVDRRAEEAVRTVIGLIESPAVAGRDPYDLAADVLSKVGYTGSGERWSHRYPVWDVIDGVGDQLGDQAAGALLSRLDANERIDACMHINGARTARLFLRGNREVQEAVLAALAGEGGPDLGEHARAQIAREVLPQMERLVPNAAADVVYALEPDPESLEIARDVLRLVPKRSLPGRAVRKKIADDIVARYAIDPAELDLRYHAGFQHRDAVRREISADEKSLIHEIRHEIGPWRRKVAALAPERVDEILLWLKERPSRGDFRWVGAHILDALPSKAVLADALCDLNELELGAKFVQHRTRGRHLDRGTLRTRVELVGRRIVFDSRLRREGLRGNLNLAGLTRSILLPSAGAALYAVPPAAQAALSYAATGRLDPSLVIAMFGGYLIGNGIVKGWLYERQRRRVPVTTPRWFLRKMAISPGVKARKSPWLLLFSQGLVRMGINTTVEVLVKSTPGILRAIA